jgi:hypothetical protein
LLQPSRGKQALASGLLVDKSVSQALVMERVGVFVRLEAICTEKHQTRF